MPTAPLANVAVKVTTSSFSTGSRVVADRDAGGVADHRAQGDRTVGYQRGQDAAADAVHRAAEELAEVHQVAADVRERAGSRAALVPPAHRRVLGRTRSRTSSGR